MRPPKTYPAIAAELSPRLRALVYGRGSVDLIHGGDAFHLNDLELERLVLAREIFLRPGRAETEEDA